MTDATDQFRMCEMDFVAYFLDLVDCDNDNAAPDPTLSRGTASVRQRAAGMVIGPMVPAAGTWRV
ncbi:hypothetical protein EU805_14490 [Salipiger sp. IMCC34102]|uniref:hypothetical protein n=1 Tax=Salipiger sp. IMCC34102 TaxID=2510647 RepID=UPI00101C3F4E|nr:hypothetical protein [Salipiger sp. IMCC34102]RYH01457.1 hypothetical protein EU805_14490 [Salipiger sp. IMCC34102]